MKTKTLIPRSAIKRPAKGADLIPVATPGEILLNQFLEPAGITQYKLAHAAGIPASRLTDIIKGRRGISADTAIRLSRAIGMTPKFWLDIQADYEIRTAERANAKDYAEIPLITAAA